MKNEKFKWNGSALGPSISAKGKWQLGRSQERVRNSKREVKSWLKSGTRGGCKKKGSQFTGNHWVEEFLKQVVHLLSVEYLLLITMLRCSNRSKKLILQANWQNTYTIASGSTFPTTCQHTRQDNVVLCERGQKSDTHYRQCEGEKVVKHGGRQIKKTGDECKNVLFFALNRCSRFGFVSCQRYHTMPVPTALPAQSIFVCNAV